jgi:transcriptional antiterminator Rof (Rho-off)
MDKPYIPISCSFHDILLDRSTRKKEVRIVYLEGEEKLEQIGIIEDVFTKNKVEYLQVRNGPIIRLDALISVDEEALADFSSC